MSTHWAIVMEVITSCRFQNRESNCNFGSNPLIPIDNSISPARCALIIECNVDGQPVKATILAGGCRNVVRSTGQRLRLASVVSLLLRDLLGNII